MFLESHWKKKFNSAVDESRKIFKKYTENTNKIWII